MCWSRYIMCLQSRLAHRLGTGYIQPPSQHVSRDISCTFRAGQPTDWGTGYIHPPFRTGGPRYITCFQNGSAEIYPPPFPAGRLRYIICLQNGLAEIYPFPFTAGRLRYIICLENGLAEIYPFPFTAACHCQQVG